MAIVIQQDASQVQSSALFQRHVDIASVRVVSSAVESASKLGDLVQPLTSQIAFKVQSYELVDRAFWVNLDFVLSASDGAENPKSAYSIRCGLLVVYDLQNGF